MSRQLAGTLSLAVLLLACTTAEAAITANTSVYLYRGEPGGDRPGDQYLDPSLFPDTYHSIAYGDPVTDVMDSSVGVSDTQKWYNLLSLVKAIYDCGSDVASDSPKFSYDCFSVGTKFLDTVNAWQGIDKVDVRQIYLSYPDYLYNKVALDFTADSDSTALDPIQPVYPNVPESAISSWEMPDSNDHHRHQRILVDLSRLRAVLGGPLFHGGGGIPVGFAVREQDGFFRVTRLSLAHSLRLLTGPTEFSATVQTTAAFVRNADGGTVDSETVANLDTTDNFRPTLVFNLGDYWGSNRYGMNTDVLNGVVHIQYAPDGQCYRNMQPYDTVHLDFSAHSDVPIYTQSSDMSVQFNGVLPNFRYPNPVVQQVTPGSGQDNGINWRTEGEGHIVTDIDTRQLVSLAPTAYWFIFVAQCPDRFLSQQAVKLALEPIQRVGPPPYVVPKAMNSAVALDFNGVPGAYSYNVYYAQGDFVASNAPMKSIPAAEFNHVVIDGLWNDVSYSFIVKSVNPAGESGPSDRVWATPFYSGGIPSDPVVLTFRASSAALVDESEPDATHESQLIVSNAWGHTRRVFMGFDLGPLPGDAVIKKAVLSLRASSSVTRGGDKTGDFSVNALPDFVPDFDEKTITWNNEPTAWGTYLGSSDMHEGHVNVELNKTVLEDWVTQRASWLGLVFRSEVSSLHWDDTISFYPPGYPDEGLAPWLSITYTKGNGDSSGHENPVVIGGN